jgi:hypothetical protein
MPGFQSDFIFLWILRKFVFAFLIQSCALASAGQ